MQETPLDTVTAPSDTTADTPKVVVAQAAAAVSDSTKKSSA